MDSQLLCMLQTFVMQSQSSAG